MKFIATFLSLVAAASAIDLYFHSNTDCTGNFAICSSLNPNICCSGSGFSTAARGIPIGWRVELRSYTGGGCTSLNLVTQNGGSQSFICNRGGFYTGTGYDFYGSKRAVARDESECQRPDTLVLTDGSKYDLSGLDETKFDALFPLGLNATSSEDLPQELKSLEISQ